MKTTNPGLKSTPQGRKRRTHSELALAEVTAWLDQELNIRGIADASLNGLQVEGRRPVRMAAVAVDASLATFKAAIESRADLLIVHHGLFWGESKTLTGMDYERIRVLIESGLGLYAAHLPLDLHPRFGNNILLARGIGLRNIEPFGDYHGQTIGFGGRLPRALTPLELVERLAHNTGEQPRLFPLGPGEILRVAVVSGGAGDLARSAAESGYQAYITGEAAHPVYHICKEKGLNLLLGGHYATETLGVKAVAKRLEKKFNIKSIFVDIPTGL